MRRTTHLAGHVSDYFPFISSLGGWAGEGQKKNRKANLSALSRWRDALPWRRSCSLARSCDSDLSSCCLHFRRFLFNEATTRRAASCSTCLNGATLVDCPLTTGCQVRHDFPKWRRSFASRRRLFHPTTSTCTEDLGEEQGQCGLQHVLLE